MTIFVDAPLAELERRLRERATESSGEIDERIDAGAAPARAGAPLPTTWCGTTTSRRATDELAALVEAELAFAATMARP